MLNTHAKQHYKCLFGFFLCVITWLMNCSYFEIHFHKILSRQQTTKNMSIMKSINLNIHLDKSQQIQYPPSVISQFLLKINPNIH